MKYIVLAIFVFSLIAVAKCWNLSCYEPVSNRGYCFGFYKLWSFDYTTGQCVPFVYGGCGGNNNRFESREQCEFLCFS
ncbi:PI-stichotoxin-She2b-like [Drosophila nasuta]|uniref:PI-stichotoxin-She2b-like n=1 Tax=Drosophila nasuta TaxID=42062 RepID=UPI001471DE45|nr:PI-stichotoxin-She2b-like [Drosophila nasuta]